MYLNVNAHVRPDTPVYVNPTTERNSEQRYSLHIGTYPAETVVFVGRDDLERIVHTLTEALHGRDPNDDPEDAE